MGHNAFDIETMYEDFIRHDDESGRNSLTRCKRMSRRLLWVAVVLLLLAFIFRAIHRFHPSGSHWAVVTELIFVLLAYMLAAIAMVIPLIVGFPKFTQEARQPSRVLLNYARKDQADYEFAARLSEYDNATLQFLARRLRSHAEAVRTKVGLSVGALDKVGVLPAALGAYLTFAQLRAQLGPVNTTSI